MLENFLQFLNPYLELAWDLIKAWWWLPLPFILWPKFKFYWLWWRNDLWFTKKARPILLEITIPKEVLKPMRAMELVLSSMWQVLYQTPDWWEKWIDGQFQLSYSFEMVSIDGESHFFIRTDQSLQSPVEAAIYSQYPDAIITVAEDYAKNVPQDIPNKKWNMWGSDYKMLKPEAYPIKTYTQFETEREAKEEKRIDPLSILLETFAKIKKDEQMWVQIKAKPISNEEKPWLDEAEELRDELAKRKEKPKKNRPLIIDALDFLFFGKAPSEEVKKEEGPSYPEMTLTPGEKESLSLIEKKMAKPAFQAGIRFIYLGKRDVYYQPNLRLPMAYFASFSTSNANSIVPWGDTLTKIHMSRFFPINWLEKRRLFLRKRRLFRWYVSRSFPKFPNPPGKGAFVLNVEELATIFHFPGRTSAPAPSFKRVDAKRGEAPPGLPT